MTIDTLSLANKIAKALFPDLYGKPGLSIEQTVLLMGSRQIVLAVLDAEFACSCPSGDGSPCPVHPPTDKLVSELIESCYAIANYQWPNQSERDRFLAAYAAVTGQQQENKS